MAADVLRIVLIQRFSQATNLDRQPLRSQCLFVLGQLAVVTAADAATDRS